MQPSTTTNPIKSILLFVVIGAVLLAAVVFGVRWAKGRSDTYAQAANKPQTVAQEPQKSEPKPVEQKSQPSSNQAQNPAPQQSAQAPAPATQPPSSVSQQQQPSTTTNKTPSTSSTSTHTPSSVPSTGVGDLVTPTLGFAALAVAGVYYVQSRRRLLRLN